MILTRQSNPRLLFAHTSLLEFVSGKIIKDLPLVTHWIVDASLYAAETGVYYADRKNEWCQEWVGLFCAHKVYMKLEWPRECDDYDELIKNLYKFQQTFGFEGFYLTFVEGVPSAILAKAPPALKMIATPYHLNPDFVEECDPAVFEYVVLPNYGQLVFDLEVITFKNVSDRSLQPTLNACKLFNTSNLIVEFSDMAMQFTKNGNNMQLIPRSRALNMELLFDYERKGEDCLDSKYRTVYYDTCDSLKRKMAEFISYCVGFSIYLDHDKDHIHPLSLYFQVSRFLFPEHYAKDEQRLKLALQKLMSPPLVLAPKRVGVIGDKLDLSTGPETTSRNMRE